MTRTFDGADPFPSAASRALGDDQLRRNLARATTTIRTKRGKVAGELPDWEELRAAGEAIRTSALANLGEQLEQFEASASAAGAHVHWARDAAEANRIVTDVVTATGVDEVVKVKSILTAEIGLNGALEAAGIRASETDLAELIVQLADDLPSHIVVPAIHRSRTEIRDIFRDQMHRVGLPAPENLTDDPPMLAAAARAHLRSKFLSARVGISGGNFLIADTGSLVIVESEGNGRMCLTLPETLISVVGIEKIVPTFRDLDVLLQLLPRSATGERMNPYTSVVHGIRDGDGPRAWHIVLVDNGRSSALADPVGSQALRCIRCAACLNVCPVYEQVGGHAYGSVYPGPIGAILTPQLDHITSVGVAASLPFASTLCGACRDACPVRIDIPRLLVRLRSDVIDANLTTTAEKGAMTIAGASLADPGRMAFISRLATLAARLAPRRAPGAAGAWLRHRTLPRPTGRAFVPGRARRTPAAGAPPHPVVDHARPLGLRQASVPATATDSRTTILARVAAATATQTMPTIDRGYRAPRDSDVTKLFIERASDYRAGVRSCDAASLPDAVAEALGSHAGGRIGIPPDLPAHLTSAVSGTLVIDEQLTADQLDGLDAVITTCGTAVAESGTVILDHGPGQGRRALTLVPDHHVLIVAADQIRDRLPDALAALDPTTTQTWISGPSATSDIELDRVEGVHGPRTLDIIVVV